MQVEKSEVFEPRDKQDQMNFIDEILNEEERKGDILSISPASENLAHQNKNVSRGKGRPKGQKNSKEGPRRTKNSSKLQNLRKGHWVLEQNKKYHWFLQIYHNHFICKEMRRLDKIFKTMSTFIGTREAEQCRSHHQKMEKKYNSFANILLYLRQSHYGSDDSAPVIEDMNKSQIKQNAILLDARGLQNIETPKTSIATLPFPEQEKEDEFLQISKFVDFGQEKNFNLFEDMLGDNYELQLELDNQFIV